MRSRTGFVLAIAGSIFITVVGLTIALTNSGSEMGTIGWAFFAFGVLFVAGNVVLRKKIR